MLISVRGAAVALRAPSCKLRGVSTSDYGSCSAASIVGVKLTVAHQSATKPLPGNTRFGIRTLVILPASPTELNDVPMSRLVRRLFAYYFILINFIPSHMSCCRREAAPS